MRSPLREVGATYTSNDGGNRPPDPPIELLQPRGFQYEMLEESLRRNIIVAVGLKVLLSTGKLTK